MKLVNLSKEVSSLRGKMNEPYTWPMHLNEEEKNSARRFLRKLRIALLIWLVVFLFMVVWFSFSS